MAVRRRKERRLVVVRPLFLRVVDFMMASYFATCAVVTGFLSVLPVDAIDAALWIAARMRKYVPQRHRLPFMARSISASVGFAFTASSAEADIICPAWQ